MNNQLKLTQEEFASHLAAIGGDADKPEAITRACGRKTEHWYGGQSDVERHTDVDGTVTYWFVD